jgi:gamma-glutamyltranspeptidase
VGDDFVDVPVQGLVDGAACQRAKLSHRKIDGQGAGGNSTGPQWRSPTILDEIAGTSQIAVVDGQGNAV